MRNIFRPRARITLKLARVYYPNLLAGNSIELQIRNYRSKKQEVTVVQVNSVSPWSTFMHIFFSSSIELQRRKNVQDK